MNLLKLNLANSWQLYLKYFLNFWIGFLYPIEIENIKQLSNVSKFITNINLAHKTKLKYLTVGNAGKKYVLNSS